METEVQGKMILCLKEVNIKSKMHFFQLINFEIDVITSRGFFSLSLLLSLYSDLHKSSFYIQTRSWKKFLLQSAFSYLGKENRTKPLIKCGKTWR